MLTLYFRHDFRFIDIVSVIPDETLKEIIPDHDHFFPRKIASFSRLNVCLLPELLCLAKIRRTVTRRQDPSFCSVITDRKLF